MDTSENKAFDLLGQLRNQYDDQILEQYYLDDVTTVLSAGDVNDLERIADVLGENRVLRRIGSSADEELPRVGFSSGFNDPQPSPSSEFTDPDVLPVDSEMREMALQFIENDLQGQVRDDKIQEAKRLFEEEATDPTTADLDVDVQDMLAYAFDAAGVDIPRNRARRFNPDDQRAIGGAAGGGVMDVQWPRGIDEQELGVVAGNMSDDGYDRELYSPLSQAKLPTDPQTLIRLAEVMEKYADIRRKLSDDYDGRGWYLRVAGVIYQAAADRMDRR